MNNAIHLPALAFAMFNDVTSRAVGEKTQSFGVDHCEAWPSKKIVP
jgi:hypothetical protein